VKWFLFLRLLEWEWDRPAAQEVEVTQLPKEKVLWVSRLVLAVPEPKVGGEIVSPLGLKRMCMGFTRRIGQSS
jgi:hypothetical protein